MKMINRSSAIWWQIHALNLLIFSLLYSLNLTRVVEPTILANPYNIMANKTFVVTSVEAAPYTLLKEDPQKLSGNNRFEGKDVI